MKSILRMLACAALVAAPVLFAQTTTKYLLGEHACGSWTGIYYCDGIPFTRMDGSQPSPSNGDAFTPPIPAYVWSNLLAYKGPILGFVPNSFYFLTNDGLDAAGTTKNVVTVTDVPSGTPGVQLVTATLVGADYTGIVQFLYMKGVPGGRYHTTPWTIISGYVQVTR